MIPEHIAKSLGTCPVHNLPWDGPMNEYAAFQCGKGCFFPYQCVLNSILNSKPEAE